MRCALSFGGFCAWNTKAKASSCVLELIRRHGSYLGIGLRESGNTKWLLVDGHHLNNFDGRLLARLQRFLAYQLGQVALCPTTRATIQGLILADAEE